MKRLRALEPAFDFSAAPQPIRLARGPMALGELHDKQGEVVLQFLPRCRIPDDYIDENRYPLFMARTVMTELMASLQASGRAQT